MADGEKSPLDAHFDELEALLEGVDDSSQRSQIMVDFLLSHPAPEEVTRSVAEANAHLASEGIFRPEVYGYVVNGEVVADPDSLARAQAYYDVGGPFQQASSAQADLEELRRQQGEM